MLKVKEGSLVFGLLWLLEGYRLWQLVGGCVQAVEVCLRGECRSDPRGLCGGFEGGWWGSWGNS